MECIGSFGTVHVHQKALILHVACGRVYRASSVLNNTDHVAETCNPATLNFQHSSPAIVTHEYVSNPHQLHLKQVHAEGLVAKILLYMIVKTIALVGLAGMHKTGCSGEARLVLHVPSS